MNKIERVTAAIEGRDVDRTPYSFWYHFGLQHRPGREHADAEIEFFRHYDLDFLKVMNDYPYPLPAGIEAVQSEKDWKKLEPVEGDDPCWAEQLTALSRIDAAIGREALFIDTVFSTWTTARRLAPPGTLDQARERYPETLLLALEAIAISLANYARESVARGAAGIFLSLGAASDLVMTSGEYEVWGRPFDMKILEAVDQAPFNVLHVHGSRIHFDSVLGYPVDALNWSHYATAPSLEDGRAKWGKAVLGGIDEANAAHMSPVQIRDQVSGAIRSAGPRGLIVAPGCSVPTDTPERNLRAVRTGVEMASRR